MNLELLKREIKTEPCIFNENIYLFDLAEGEKIIGARSPFEEMNLDGDPFFDIDEEEIPKIKEHLKSYSEEPFVVEGRGGKVIFLPYLMPSSSIGIAIKGSGVKDISEKTSALQRMALPNEFPRDITDILRERIKDIASVVGVRACIDMGDEPIIDYGNFEEGIFRAFVFLSLLLARRISETRGVDISVSISERLGIIVSTSFSIYQKNDGFFPEISTLRGLAIRKNIYFDCAADEHVICFSIAPAIKDWSKLGLKHSDIFDWDS